MVCTRIGGISMGQKEKCSDIHANEPKKNSLTQLIRRNALGIFRK